MCIVVLRPRIIHCIQIGTVFGSETLSLRVEYIFTFCASLHLSEVFNESSFLQRHALDGLWYFLNGRGRPIEEPYFLEMGLHSLLFIWSFQNGITYEFKLW